MISPLARRAPVPKAELIPGERPRGKPLPFASFRVQSGAFSGALRWFAVCRGNPLYASDTVRQRAVTPSTTGGKKATHGTASVFINDDESGLHRDFERWLEKLAPEKPHSQYAHNGGEDNADAHLKRSIMGREVVVAVSEGRLDFGPWEQIFYGEFDGLRRKRVLVKIIGE